MSQKDARDDANPTTRKEEEQEEHLKALNDHDDTNVVSEGGNEESQATEST